MSKVKHKSSQVSELLYSISLPWRLCYLAGFRCSIKQQRNHPSIKLHSSSKGRLKQGRTDSENLEPVIPNWASKLAPPKQMVQVIKCLPTKNKNHCSPKKKEECLQMAIHDTPCNTCHAKGLTLEIFTFR